MLREIIIIVQAIALVTLSVASYYINRQATKIPATLTCNLQIEPLSPLHKALSLPTRKPQKGESK